MGASEILAVLETGDELTAIEIAERIDCGAAAVKQSIKRILKDVSESVVSRRLTPEEKEVRYGHKIGCRINIYCIEGIVNE